MKATWFFLAGFTLAAQAAPPEVSNIRASQRPGTKLVDIYYDLADADGDQQAIAVQVSADGGLTWTIPAVTFNGDYGTGVALGANKHIVWDAGADWGGNFVEQARVRVTAHDGTTPPAPPGMAYIPPGPFQMGDNFIELSLDTRPVHNVEVDGFFMDKTEVTKALWEQVKAWGIANGYGISNGSYKGDGYPVGTVTWYDAVKWCNARSEMEGLTPCYYTGADHTEVYRTGNLSLTNNMVDWEANGYRLPTEAEWEKAARGGRTGQRYPWGDDITGDDANFLQSGDPFEPSTSPVGYYPPNDYGLFDMAGNVSEWCWDWYSNSYYGAPESGAAPHGPDSGSTRVYRSGDFEIPPIGLRCAYRDDFRPSTFFSRVGFRCARAR